MVDRRVAHIGKPDWPPTVNGKRHWDIHPGYTWYFQIVRHSNGMFGIRLAENPDPASIVVVRALDGRKEDKDLYTSEEFMLEDNHVWLPWLEERGTVIVFYDVDNFAARVRRMNIVEEN